MVCRSRGRRVVETGGTGGGSWEGGLQVPYLVFRFDLRTILVNGRIGNRRIRESAAQLEVEGKARVALSFIKLFLQKDHFTRINEACVEGETDHQRVGGVAEIGRLIVANQNHDVTTQQLVDGYSTNLVFGCERFQRARVDLDIG